MTDTTHHVTVFLQEAVTALNVQPDAWYIDATYGRGGHSREIIARGGRVVAFDVDQEAIEYAQTHEQQLIEQHKLLLIRANFDQLQTELSRVSATQPLDIKGILFDFGTSTNQLMSPTRGFSFESESPLDMRMDQRLGVTAEDMLRVLTEKQLSEAFAHWGGEREAKATARAAKTYVLAHTPVTAKGLAEAITKAKREKRGKLHPATKVFQALRILVNTELDSIEQALPQALKLLKKDGRIVTIAFHEGEDRLAKRYFAQWEKEGRGYRSPKDAVVASTQELELNPRARSAKLRTFIVC